MNEQINQNYYETKSPNSNVPHSPNAGQIIFWVFYVLVGFWVDLALTVTFWVMAVILPFTFPFIVAIGGNTGLYSNKDIILVPGDFLYGLTDSQLYTVTGMTSIAGLVLLVLAILTLKPWFRFHRAMFQHLGGVTL